MQFRQTDADTLSHPSAPPNWRSRSGGTQISEAHELRLASGQDPVDWEGGSIFFIGNATVLIRCAGITILTDPTFIHMHEETWLGYGLHTKRLTNPAIEIAELPPLDFVLLSHFHGDHFAQVAERELDKALPIVTTPESVKELQERYPEVDLAMLHLGGTRVMGILVTMDGEQGVEMMRIVNPRTAIPIHYNDYDVFTSPLSDFQEAVDAAGLGDRVHYLAHGETYTFGLPTRS